MSPIGGGVMSLVGEEGGRGDISSCCKGSSSRIGRTGSDSVSVRGAAIIASLAVLTLDILKT